MKISHKRMALLSPDGKDIVKYVHERHNKGQCPWCDYIRVVHITEEFISRSNICEYHVTRLHMWTLGTSLKDTAYNRDEIRARWRIFTKRLWHYKKWIPVFRVLERGKRGYLHFHVVAIRFFEHKIVLDAWRGLCGEKCNVHVSSSCALPERGSRGTPALIRYLTKYLCKGESTYRWLGPFYGLGRDTRRALTLKKSDLLYGGECYGGYDTECYSRKKEQKQLYTFPTV